MDPKIRQKFRDLIANNQSVMIKYHGGSQPGTTRRIEPLSITETHVRAIDSLAKKSKLFSLNKVEFVDDVSEETYVNMPKPFDRGDRDSNLIDVFKNHAESLEILGWTVRLTEKSIELYEEGRKKPRAGLRPNYDVALSIGRAGSKLEQVDSERPWYVFGPGYIPDRKWSPADCGVSYKYLKKAAEVLLDFAHRSPPRRKNT